MELTDSISKHIQAMRSPGRRRASKGVPHDIIDITPVNPLYTGDMVPTPATPTPVKVGSKRKADASPEEGTEAPPAKQRATEQPSEATASGSATKRRHSAKQPKMSERAKRARDAHVTRMLKAAEGRLKKKEEEDKS